MSNPAGPSGPFALSQTDVWKIARDAGLVALGAIAAWLVETMLPDMKERGVIDAALFTLITTLILALRRFITDYTKVSVWLLAGLLVLPGNVMADDVTIRFTGITKGQSYELSYGADASIVLRPIVTVPVGGNPTPTPTPTPNPTPAPNPTLSGQVKALTERTLVEGGSSLTAAKLAAVYSAVGSQVASDRLALGQIGPALQELSNAMIPANEVEKWRKWREDVAVLRAGKENTKADALATLGSIETGIKSAVDGLARASGSPAINWQMIFEMLLPILLKLIEKFLFP